MKKHLLFLLLVTLVSLAAAFLLCLWLDASAYKTVPAEYRPMNSLSVTYGE